MIAPDVLNDRVSIVGFFADLFPWSKRFLQRMAVHLCNGLNGVAPARYNQSLVLYGQGFIQCRYTFAVDGTLYPNWRF